MVCPPCPLLALFNMKKRANARAISLLPSDVYYDNTDDGGMQRGSTATRRRKIKVIFFTKTSEAVINFGKERGWGRNLQCTPKVSNPLFPVWDSS